MRDDQKLRHEKRLSRNLNTSTQTHTKFFLALSTKKKHTLNGIYKKLSYIIRWILPYRMNDKNALVGIKNPQQLSVFKRILWLYYMNIIYWAVYDCIFTTVDNTIIVGVCFAGFFTSGNKLHFVSEPTGKIKMHHPVWNLCSINVFIFSVFPILL